MVAALQRDMFTKRYRKVQLPTPTENQIQIALIDRLKFAARKDAVWFHIPNGGKRPPRQTALFKALGVMPGVADLVFIWPVRNILFLELKAKGRTPSDEQLHFKDMVLPTGAAWAWADNLDDAVSILQSSGILPRINR